MWKINKLNNKGYHTVEATVIIASIIIITALLITLSFAFFNRCSLERAAVSGALRASEMIFETGEKRSGVANAAVEEILTNNILGTDDIYKNVHIGGNDIEITLETKYRNWDFVTQSKKEVLNPVMFIRLCRKIKGAVK